MNPYGFGGTGSNRLVTDRNDTRALPSPNSDLRSLLQKAIRRGQIELARSIVHRLVELNDRDWLRRRAFVFVFEEAWDTAHIFAEDLVSGRYSQVIEGLCDARKDRSAASLGAMAYAFSQGDQTVLSFAPDSDLLRNLAEGLTDAQGFWTTQCNELPAWRSLAASQVVRTGIRLGNWPWDKAAMLASLLLVPCGNGSEIQSQATRIELPLWVALDRHTLQGKKAISEVASQVNLSETQVGWLAFIFEGARASNSRQSVWWDAEVTWRLSSLGLTREKASTHWQKLELILPKFLDTATESLNDRLKCNQVSLFGEI